MRGHGTWRRLLPSANINERQLGARWATARCTGSRERCAILHRSIGNLEDATTSPTEEGKA